LIHAVARPAAPKRCPRIIARVNRQQAKAGVAARELIHSNADP